MSPLELASIINLVLAAGLDNGVLTVTGTDNAESIVISQAADQIVVDIDGVQSSFPAADVAQISIAALAGDDTIVVNVNRPTMILAGAGNDAITGSDGGADIVFGQQGGDTFAGRGGDDTFTWNPGDGSDVIDGGDGDDTHVFNGSGADETIDVTPDGGRIVLFRNVGSIVMDIGTFENITVNALGGSDIISGAVGLQPLLALLALDGGAAGDFINGGDGNDLLLGGDGNDTVDGNRGADTAFLGAGDDAFIWDPGDGSDVVEGEGDFDELVFNGAGAAERFVVSPAGQRVVLFRNVGNISMDLDGVESIVVAALGGADETTVNDTAGTALEQVTIDLAAALGGGGGDGLADAIFINGGEGDDAVTVAGDAALGISIAGLSAAIEILNPDPGVEQLAIDLAGGNDSADASLLAADAARLAMAAGEGNDTLLGGAGDDILDGGDDDDFVDGNRGADTAALGGGDDTFRWDPGDGSDIVEGEAGFDTLLFNGSGADETFDASADGARLRFFRNVGNIVMDVVATERLDLRAMGGNDATTINDLSGTDVTDVIVDGGAGGDTFTGSALSETFLGGEGDDTADFGDDDVFDMGAGFDTLLFFGTPESDVILVNARAHQGRDEAFFIGTLHALFAVFDRGEAVTISTQGGDDRVQVLPGAEQRWTIQVVD